MLAQPVIIISPDGSPENKFFDFSYDPLFDKEGQVEGILVTANDVTVMQQAAELLQNRQEELETMNEELTAAGEELQSINEKLSATNEEFEASNEELTATNEELQNAQQRIARINLELTDSEEYLTLAAEAAGLGIWRLDLADNSLQFNERCRAIFGFSADEELTLDIVLQTLVPDYISAAQAALQRAINDQPSEYDAYITDQATGEKRWVRGISKARRSAGNQQYLMGIVLDLTEQKKDEVRKNDFIGIVSHELKTPLTSLKGFLQVINHQAVKEEQKLYKSSSERALAQVSKMERLVEGFLDVARLGSGKIHLQKRSFNFDDMVQRSISDNRLQATGHFITYEPCTDLLIIADEDKIEQVVNNLLSNALKYSAKGSRVTVRCSSDQTELRFSVNDEGQGIAPHDVGRLFERIYRVDNQHTQNIPGFGIGLYVCAEIVERHQGKIWAESVPGQGSVFHMTLPLNN